MNIKHKIHATSTHKRVITYEIPKQAVQSIIVVTTQKDTCSMVARGEITHSLMVLALPVPITVWPSK